MRLRPRLARAGLACACLAVLGAGGGAHGQARPPVVGIAVDGPVDLDRLLQVTRLREAMTARLVHAYTYRQVTTQEDLDQDGNVRKRHSRTYLVVPTPQGTQRHLIGKDGQEPTAAEVRKQEKRNEQLQKRLERMRDRARRLQAEKAAPPQPAASPPARATPPPAPPPAPAPASLPAPAAPPRADVPASSAPAPPVPEPASSLAAGDEPDSPAEASAANQPPPAPPMRPALRAEARPALADLPACDLEDPLASVRPPLPGSITRARAPGLSASEQARRRRERTSDYSLFELLNLTDHEYAGACTWQGRPMHVVAFRPPASFDPLNPVERVASAMAGSILIDASDMEVARASGSTVAPITWGGGLVKLKSASVLLEYTQVRGEFWLPALEVFEMRTRVFFDKDSFRVTHAFDEFVKAEVATEFEYGEPVLPDPAPTPDPRR